MPVPANGRQPMEPSSPLRTRPSSLNTQLYTAENFIKLVSRRDNMYNPQNQFLTLEENETSSFHDMDIEPTDQATKMVSSPCKTTSL